MNQLTVKLYPHEIEQLSAIAEQNGITRHRVILTAVRDVLKASGNAGEGDLTEKAFKDKTPA